MTNTVRGEVAIKGPDGTDYNLCLSMGAMAELEKELGLEDITKIGSRLTKPTSEDLITIILCLLHGGGHEDITREELRRWPFNVKTVTKAMTAAFSAAGLDDDDEDSDPAKEPASGN